MISDTLLNAAYCMSPRGPGAELDGVVQTLPPPPSPARSVRRRAPAWCGLIDSVFVVSL